MKTTILKIKARHPEPRKIAQAAAILQHGGIVAFPTETVYGLGARLTDQQALKKIFRAKKRPADNPLIVHVADVVKVEDVAELTPLAKKLMEKFWPGPLTFVLKKKPIVPDLVTAGLPCVAVRMPSHPVALALIKATDEPIAAPSANLACRPSPTTAEHVYSDLKGRIPLILDAGPTTVGLESTVLDLVHTPPTILRPGAVTFEQLKKFLPNLCNPATARQKISVIPTSPGMKYQHYAPKAKLILVIASRAKQDQASPGPACRQAGIATARKAGLAMTYIKNTAILDLRQEKNLKKVARQLFASLRNLDQKGVKNIVVYGVLEKGIGQAIMNRLRKAASQIIE